MQGVLGAIIYKFLEGLVKLMGVLSLKSFRAKMAQKHVDAAFAKKVAKEKAKDLNKVFNE